LNDVGADKLSSISFSRRLGMAASIRSFAAHYDVDPDEIGRLIAQCDAKYGLKLNPVGRARWQMYFARCARSRNIEKGWGDTTGTQEHICNTYGAQHHGRIITQARLCFSWASGQAAQGAGDFDPLLERRRAHSRAHAFVQAYCGISHSVAARDELRMRERCRTSGVAALNSIVQRGSWTIVVRVSTGSGDSDL